MKIMKIGIKKIRNNVILFAKFKSHSSILD